MSATVISVSIPQPLLIRLNNFCDVEERSKSFCVRKALEKYLEEKSMNEAANKKKKTKKQ